MSSDIFDKIHQKTNSIIKNMQLGTSYSESINFKDEIMEMRKFLQDTLSQRRPKNPNLDDEIEQHLIDLENNLMRVYDLVRQRTE